IPQIAVVMGSCTAGGAYVPAMADEAIMVSIRQPSSSPAHPWYALPPARWSAPRSWAAPTCTAAPPGWRTTMRKTTSMPWPWPGAASACSTGANTASCRPARRVRPSTLSRSFTARCRLVDDSEFDEFKALFGPTLVCAFAHLHGYPVAILANNGILFSEAAQKGAHFIQLACQRGIPLVFLQNITGFMVGQKYEAGGIA